MPHFSHEVMLIMLLSRHGCSNTCIAEAQTKRGPLPTQPKQLTPLPKARKTEITWDTEGSGYGIIAGIACAVLIVVVTVVVILYRQKLFNSQACCASGGGSEQKVKERNDGEHQYEVIPMQNKDESADQTFYSTVNLQADQLNYASINILNSGTTVADEEDKNGSFASKSNPEGPQRPPTVTTVYSTIGKLGE